LAPYYVLGGLTGPVGRTGGAFYFREQKMIDPYVVVAMALGFAVVASLMLTAIEQ
jgi:hypothetical protein